MQCEQDSYYNTTQVPQGPASEAEWADRDNGNYNYSYDARYGCVNQAGVFNCNLDFYRYCEGGNPGGWTTVVDSYKQGNVFNESWVDELGDQYSFNVRPYTVQCIPKVPTMTDAQIKKCCSFQEPKPKGNCGIGFCPAGDQCVSNMARICQQLDSNGNWDPACDTYFGIATNTQETNPAFQQLITAQLGKTNYTPDNPFNKYAQKYCSLIPGACDTALTQYCSNVQRGELVFDSMLVDLCGCFMPNDLNHYPFLNKEIQVECDPVCVISKVQQSTGNTLKRCDKTVCIIDDVSFNIVNSSKGKIDIKQICGKCAKKSENGAVCSQCYIDGVSINEINSLTNGITIDQVCGQCFAPGATAQDPTTIPCGGSGGPPLSSKRKIIIAIVAFAVVSIVSFGILIELYRKNKISRVLFASLISIVLVINVVIGILSVYVYKKESVPWADSLQQPKQSISQIKNLSVYLSGGKWVMKWDVPTSNITTPDPIPIEYSIKIYDANLNSIGEPYQGVKDNFIFLNISTPGSYQAQIVAYSGSVLSPTSMIPFVIQPPVVIKNIEIVSVNTSGVVAQTIVKAPKGIQKITGTFNIWFPPNSPQVNPTKPSFSFPCDPEVLDLEKGYSKILLTFDMQNLKIGTQIYVRGQVTCPTHGGKNIVAVKYAMVPHMSQGINFITSVFSSSSSYRWIIDPVTGHIINSANNVQRWSTRVDNVGASYICLDQIPSAYLSGLTFGEGVSVTTPYINMVTPDLQHQYQASYVTTNEQCTCNANGQCSGKPINIFSMDPPNYNSNFDLKDCSYTISTSISTSAGVTNLQTDPQVF